MIERLRRLSPALLFDEQWRKDQFRRPFLRLVTHFFDRLFTAELSHADADGRIGVGAVLAVVAMPGLMLPLLLLPKYSSLLLFLRRLPRFDVHEASVPDKLMFVSLAMCVSGAVAVIQWDKLFPDRTDFMNLSPLPISARSIFLAKALALTAFLGLFVATLNIPHSVLVPYIVLYETGTGPELLRFAFAHLAATVAASMFAFLSFTALAGLLMVALPYRMFRRVSLWAQFLAIVTLMVMLLLTPEALRVVQDLRANPDSMARLLPPIWFLGLYQVIQGRSDAVYDEMAAIAVTALLASAVLAAGCYLLSYRRYNMLAFESQTTRGRRPGALQRLGRRIGEALVVRSDFERACFFFIWRTFSRNRPQQLIFAAYAGLGTAISVQWLATSPPTERMPAALSIPLVLSFCVLCGMRFVFGVPANLPANWIFQIAPDHGEDEVERLLRKTMRIPFIPILASTCLAAFTWLYGWRIGVVHTALVVLLSLFLIDGLLVRFRRVPFTCASRTDVRRVLVRIGLYALAFLAFASIAVRFELSVMDRPSRLPGIAIVWAAAWWALRRWGVTGPERAAVVFEEPPDAPFQLLNLQE